MKASVKAALLLLIIFAIGFTVSFILEKNIYKLQTVELTYTGGEPEKLAFETMKSDIKSVLDNFIGKEVWKVDLTEIMGLIETDKRIASVQVLRQFPNSIKVEVTPHKPVLNLVGKSGRMIPVARDGSVLPALAARLAPDLPVLRGLNFHRDQKLRESAIDALYMLSDQGVLTADEISEVRYRKKSGFELFLNTNGTMVKLGHRNFEKKLEQVEKVLKYLKSEQLEGRVIDARFSKKVVVRLRNAP